MCAITASGELICWSLGTVDRRPPFLEGPLRTADTNSHGTLCGVRGDGELVCESLWEGPDSSQWIPPSGSFVSVSVGVRQACALRQSGQVVCWGKSVASAMNAPVGRPAVFALPGTSSSVSSGWYHVCGLQTSGELYCWGNNDSGRADAPEGAFRSVSAGSDYSCETVSVGGG